MLFWFLISRIPVFFKALHLHFLPLETALCTSFCHEITHHGWCFDSAHNNKIVPFAGYCVYLDAENALDPSLAEAMGVNTENLLIARPSCAENSLSMVNTLVNSGSVDVIVVDSVCKLNIFLF